MMVKAIYKGLVMTTFNFEDGKGQVPAHKHPNGGGWVADTAYVDETVYVGRDARVSGYARVYGVKRSDGYAFCYVPDKDGVMRVIAGCRYFTMEEARKHWQQKIGGTPLGDETMAILDFLEESSKVRPEGCV